MKISHLEFNISKEFSKLINHRKEIQLEDISGIAIIWT